MPEPNGFEFYCLVRQINFELAARIVFVSGGAPTWLAHDIKTLPNLLLNKPVALQVLLDAVALAIGTRPSGAGA